MAQRPDPMGMGEGFFWWGVSTLFFAVVTWVLPESIDWLFQVSGPWFG